MKTIIILFFGIITISANAQILNVPEITQEQTEWCWAAVSKCVLDYYNFPYLQCEIAEYTRNVSTWHNFGSTPCCNSALQGCNYWNYNWGVNGSIQDILVHFGSISNYGVGSPLSISDIQNNINQHRPFIIRWGWISGGGHFIVGHGIQGNNVYYMDPWFGEGFKVSTYANLINNGQHIWTHTNVITVSPVTYTLSASSNTSHGTVSGSGKFAKNTTVTLTANPNPDFEFVNWTSNGIEIATENPFTFILTQDTVINANFNYVSITENTLISSIKILPNPVHNDAIIEINCLASQPNTVITILDLSGREIITVYSGLLDEGINNFPMPNNYSLANGTYFVSVSNSKGRKVERFVVAM